MTRELKHYGIPGQKWGVKNGPPYPLSYEKSSRVRMKADNYSGYGAHFTKRELSKYEGQTNLSNLKRISSSDNEFDVLDNVCKDIQDWDLYNCQNCSVAFELIRRGYKVKAKPRKEGSNVGDIEEFYKGGKLKKVAKDIPKDDLQELARLRDEENRLRKMDEKDFSSYEELEKAYDEMLDVLDKQRAIRDKLFNNAISDCKNEILSYGDNSRGTIVIGWNMSEDYSKRTTGFHAFNFETIDGSINFYDVQSHRPWKRWGDPGLSSFVSGMDPRELYVMRTDNLELSDNVLEAVY